MDTLMTTSLALPIAILISLSISTALMFTLSTPLRTMLNSICDDTEEVTFWVVFSALMLYVVPLLAGLVFAVGSVPEAGVNPASGMTRILSSVLAGTLFALAGIGIQLSKHSRSVATRRWRDGKMALDGRSD